MLILISLWPRKKKTQLTLFESLQRIKHAGLEGSKTIFPPVRKTVEELSSIDERIKHILGIVNNPKRDTTNILFFVMYDIEDNKVRYQVSKYLLAKGCFRVQRSIFLADLSIDSYHQIQNDLTEVQSFYENNDSILIVPVSTELLQAIRVIGQ